MNFSNAGLTKQCVLGVCSALPIGVWHRLSGVELVLPYWHTVSNDDLKHISGVQPYRNVAQFRADIEYFLRHYEPVSLDEVMRWVDGAQGLPRRCFLPSFDDGLAEAYGVVAPILQSLGVPAVFFITTSVLDNRRLCFAHRKSLVLHAAKSLRGTAAEREAGRLLKRAGYLEADIIAQIKSVRDHASAVLDAVAAIFGCDFGEYLRAWKPYLTCEQVTALLRSGFAIGAHSLDHPFYPDLELSEQLRQTLESVRILSSTFGYNCQAFAFPYMDRGIQPCFYEAAFRDSRLKLTFGTGGVRQHFFQRNLSRIGMERGAVSAAQQLAAAFLRTLLHRMTIEDWCAHPFGSAIV